MGRVPFCSDTFYSVHGSPDDPTVVFIHGLGLDSTIWKEIGGEVQNEGYRVVYYDLLGHGCSAFPGAGLSLRTFSNQLLKLLDSLSIDVCSLVGFSLGGMINRRFTLDYPQRVKVLAIFNTPHERSPEERKRLGEQAQLARNRSWDHFLQSTMERWFTASFRDHNVAFVDRIRRRLKTNDPLAYDCCRTVLAEGVTELVRPQRTIASPTLIMTCENDSGSTPAMARAMAEEISDSELIIVPELRHMGLCEQPHTFSAALVHFFERRVKGDGENRRRA